MGAVQQLSGSSAGTPGFCSQATTHPPFVAAPDLLPCRRCLQWLIKRTRASFPRADGKDRTPLHYTARLGQTRLLRWLLESGQYR
jgi:hypothetical protein